MENNEFKIVKYINDNVYGGIGLTKKEFELINTRTFQRLRRIKQQGLLSYVFPSSEHTRFSHSLGVLYIMGKMTDHLVDTGDLKNEDRIKLRYAALLHDIGHYPLSHLTEGVYNTIDADAQESAFTTNVQSEQLVRPLIKFAHKCGKKSAHHEKLGAAVIEKRKDIKDILESEGVDPKEIGQIIQGTTDNLIYHQLMHSSFDADRLDYLLRDSMSAGVKYGLIDLDYLIRLIKVGDFNISTPDNYDECKKVMGINVKGVHALEHYLMARYFSYSQVTMHRTSAAFEVLAKAVIYELAQKKYIYENYDKVIDIVDKDEFLAFDDSYLWEAVIKFREDLKNEDGSSNGIYEQFIETLIERKKIKMLYEIKEIVTNPESKVEGEEETIDDNKTKIKKVTDYIDANLSKIAEALNVDVRNIGYLESVLSIEVPVNCGDEKNDTEAAKVYKNEKCIQLKDEQSSLVKELFDKSLHIFRVFLVCADNEDCNEQKATLEKKLMDAGF